MLLLLFTLRSYATLHRPMNDADFAIGTVQLARGVSLVSVLVEQERNEPLPCK
jgi:hypothetical protein